MPEIQKHGDELSFTFNLKDKHDTIYPEFSPNKPGKSARLPPDLLKKCNEFFTDA